MEVGVFEHRGIARGWHSCIAQLFKAHTRKWCGGWCWASFSASYACSGFGSPCFQDDIRWASLLASWSIFRLVCFTFTIKFYTVRLPQPPAFLSFISHTHIMYLIIFICTCLIILTLLSICAQQLHELQASVLAYGKLNLHNNKKPATRWAHHLSKWTVPKHYFSHFYVVGLSTAILSMAELLSLRHFSTPLFMMQLLDRYDTRIGTHHLPRQQCILGLSLLTLHLARRVYESFWVEKPSKTATMHASHYLIGVGFYGAMVLGTWLEGVSNVEESPLSQQDTYVNLTSLFAVALFFYASYHQYRCHVILSLLRQSKDQASSYSIPRGDWFETLVTPHYFADILIYLSLNILYRFQNYILICGLIWTIVNLSVVSGETQLWYQTHFSAEKLHQAFPHGRKRIIPGLY